MKKRSSNIELLRVISMFMVVMIHLLTKTSVLWEMNQNQAVYYISWIFYGLCMTGVNCYVLISGYFYKESEFKLKKLLSLYFQVLFYSIVIALAAYFMQIEFKSSKRQIVFPITNREYWFVTTYLGLYCLTPYLNMAIQHLKKVQYKSLLMILTLFFSVIPTFMNANNWLGDGGAYGIAWFIFLYLLGAYIRNYYKDGMGRKIMVFYFVSVLIIPFSKFLLKNHSELLYSFNSLPALCASVFLFLTFCSIKVNNLKISNIINFFGGLTFGVYLIHNNRNISGYLWTKLQINLWLVEKNNIFIIILILLCVFIVCSIIEWIRQQLFKMFKINVLTEIIAEKLEVLFRKISKQPNI